MSGADREAVHVLGKEINGELYLIAVNATPEPAKVDLTMPDRWRAASVLRELAADAAGSKLSAGKLALELPPYEVRLFTTDRGAPELTTREELDRRFRAQRDEFLATGNLCYSERGTVVRVSKDYGRIGKARLAIDGYRDYANECCRGAKKGSWLEVRFPRQETVSRVEVSSNSFSDRWSGAGRLTDYQLQVLAADKWKTTESAAADREADDVFTRVRTFTPVRTAAIRVVMGADAKDVGCINEIEAFASAQ